MRPPAPAGSVGRGGRGGRGVPARASLAAIAFAAALTMKVVDLPEPRMVSREATRLDKEIRIDKSATPTV